MGASVDEPTSVMRKYAMFSGLQSCHPHERNTNAVGVNCQHTCQCVIAVVFSNNKNVKVACQQILNVHLSSAFSYSIFGLFIYQLTVYYSSSSCYSELKQNINVVNKEDTFQTSCRNEKTVDLLLCEDILKMSFFQIN